MEKFLIDQILKLVSDIDSSIDTLQKVNGTRKITEYLNIEHGIGKYHAFIECLEEINLDEFVRTHDLTKQRIDKAFGKLEEIAVIVEAENIEEAIKKAEDAVEREEIILDVDDYDDRDYRIRTKHLLVRI